MSDNEDSGQEEISERDFEGALSCLLEEEPLEFDLDTDTGVDSVRTFEDAGVLTNNRGLVIRMSDGAEFQLTIVRSR